MNNYRTLLLYLYSQPSADVLSYFIILIIKMFLRISKNNVVIIENIWTESSPQDFIESGYGVGVQGRKGLTINDKHVDCDPCAVCISRGQRHTIRESAIFV